MSDIPGDPREPDPPPDDDVPTDTDEDDLGASVDDPTDDASIGTDDDDDDDDFDESVYDLTNTRRSLGGKGLVGVAIGVVVLLGAGAAFVLTGGEDGGGGDTPSASERDEAQAAMLQADLDFAQCMRENGVEDFPDPPPPGSEGPEEPEDEDDPGPDEDPDFVAADETCRPIVDEVRDRYGPGEPTPEELAQMQDDALAFAQCMRDHGWDFPDPQVITDPGGGNAAGVEVKNEGNLPDPGDPDFDQFEQDMDECQEGDGPQTNSGGDEG